MHPAAAPSDARLLPTSGKQRLRNEARIGRALTRYPLTAESSKEPRPESTPTISNSESPAFRATQGSAGRWTVPWAGSSHSPTYTYELTTQITRSASAACCQVS